MVDTPKTTRRSALGLIATGAVLSAANTFGFSNMMGTRGLSVNATTDPEALIRLLVNDSVQKNQQEPLVTVTNTLDEELTVTIRLSDCDQGILTSPDGSSGCSVEFDLAPSGADGDSKTVDITSDANGSSVSFTVTATSSQISFEATRSTTVESGNTDGAVEITTLKQFRANSESDIWTIREVEAVSNSDTYELKNVVYEVVSDDGDGDVVGRLEEDESVSGDRYHRTGNNQNPAITIEPDDGHEIEKRDEYELTITVYDEGGNFGRRTATHKAN